MKDFFDKYCEKSPSVDGCEAEWTLPPVYTWHKVYGEYVKYMEANTRRLQVISESYFLRMRKQHYRHVKVPKKNRWAKCSKYVFCKFVGQLVQSGTLGVVPVDRYSCGARILHTHVIDIFFSPTGARRSRP